VKTIVYFLIKLACIGAVFALAACGHSLRRQFVSHRGKPGDLSVLFIGNSYSFGVPKAFAKLARKRGYAVHVDQVTNGGWSLAQHVENEETLRKIRERKWDVVVIQEQSRIPSLPARRVREMIPCVSKLADEARQQGARPVLYQTWGRRDGDPWRNGDDFRSMNSRLRDGYRAAAKQAGGLTIVPVGDAWEREMAAGNSTRLFDPDGSHPTKYGDSVSAEVFYETLFGK
jgi:hypothetical protein